MNLGSALRSISGWLLLIALVYAPWALGCVPPRAIRGLAALTLTSAGCWALGLILQRARPAIPRIAGCCVLLLLIQGWWMVLNAHGRYVADTDQLLPVQSIWPSAAGAVDGPVCGAMMLQITAVLAALLVACDLATQSVWRWRFIAVLAGTGFSIAIWGLLQKAGVLPALAHRDFAASVFATYNYHGNAGAYLNLAIPAVFALAVARHRQGGIAALLICLAAALVNVSRAAAVITVAMMIVLVAWNRRAAFAPTKRTLGVVLFTAFVTVMLAAGGTAWHRWNQLASMEIKNNPRLLMLQIAAPMALDAGFFGDGPGSFKLIYPTSEYMIHDLYRRWKVAPYIPGQAPSIYSYVHNDYLQFTIEWGWAGALLWLGILAAAVANGLRAYRGDHRLIIAVSLIALAGVLIHALVDWPLQVASLQLDVAIYLALLLAAPKCAFS
jgi:O-antigen ligase